MFPLSYPTLKVTEVTGVLGEEKPWKENANVFYFQDGEDDVEIVIRGPGDVLAAGTLRSVQIGIKSFVGEYLLNYPDEVVPEGPYTSNGIIRLSNNTVDFFESYYENPNYKTHDPDPGSIICIGIKLGDLPDNMEINALRTDALFLDYSLPFGGSLEEDNFNTDKIVSEANKNSWTTLMWTGTRWVWMGSNNWTP